MSQVELPPMPEQISVIREINGVDVQIVGYTEQQMRDYGIACARAALEAAAQECDGWRDHWIEGARGAPSETLSSYRYAQAEAAGSMAIAIRALSVGSEGGR